MLEGPCASPFSWTVERDVPHGRVREEMLDGRRVWLYEPPAVAEAGLLLFDGHEYTALAKAPTVLDNLLAEGLIPPVAAVLPDSPETERRIRELGGDAAFLTWCCERLLPWSGVDASPERMVVAGSSMGGLASTWFASERCDLFGCAIVQSGGFPGMPIVVPAGLPLRFYLDVGSSRTGCSTRPGRSATTFAARATRSPTRSTPAATTSSGGARRSRTGSSRCWVSSSAKRLLESRVVAHGCEVVVVPRLLAKRREQLHGPLEVAERLVTGLAGEGREAGVVVV